MSNEANETNETNEANKAKELTLREFVGKPYYEIIITVYFNILLVIAMIFKDNHLVATAIEEGLIPIIAMCCHFALAYMWYIWVAKCTNKVRIICVMLMTIIFWVIFMIREYMDLKANFIIMSTLAIVNSVIIVPLLSLIEIDFQKEIESLHNQSINPIDDETLTALINKRKRKRHDHQ